MKKTKTHGGKRPGSGRPASFNCASAPVTTKVPVDKIQEFKEMASAWLQQFRK